MQYYKYQYTIYPKYYSELKNLNTVKEQIKQIPNEIAFYTINESVLQDPSGVTMINIRNHLKVTGNYIHTYMSILSKYRSDHISAKWEVIHSAHAMRPAEELAVPTSFLKKYLKYKQKYIQLKNIK